MGEKLSKKDQVRLAAENSLQTFIELVSPQRVLGSVHKELIEWWTRQDAKSHQLVLLPRDHQKSAMIAYRVLWTIVNNPDIRILYLSSTSLLAEKQLKFMKDILTSEVFMYYWPEFINPEEGKRERWTVGEISIDHPKRKEEGVRDSTIFTAGLTTSLTGLHCDVAVFDDVVVKENAYTNEGREKVKSQYSLLSSIEGAEAKEWVVGTRYHPKDLYNDLQEMAYDTYDEQGNILDSAPVYEVFERQVESAGDGTGQFLWARQQRYDGKWFGFNRDILAKKRAQYLDRTQFRAQYYNNPNESGEGAVKRETFQYYDTAYINRKAGVWMYKNKRLNIFAAVDFAYSLNKRSDYTAIVVVGIDHEGMIYVLDVDRFKTDRIKDYFEHIFNLHTKWHFRKLRAEATVAQKTIITELKNSYIRPYGLALSIDEYYPTKEKGTKEERILSTLQPRYDNLSIWHYRGGNCQILEDELVLSNPPHDDVKDALASAIDIAIPPSSRSINTGGNNITNINIHPKFGGVSF